MGDAKQELDAALTQAMTEGACHTIEDLAREVGVERPELIGKALYKGTRCGIAFRYAPPLATNYGSVTVSGYAEGSDAELTARTLNFPFTAAQFWAEVEAADQEGCDAWAEANSEES